MLFSGSERYTDSLRTRIIRSSPPTMAILVSRINTFKNILLLNSTRKWSFWPYWLFPNPSEIARDSPMQTGNWSIRSRTRTDRVRCRAKKNAVCNNMHPATGIIMLVWSSTIPFTVDSDSSRFFLLSIVIGLPLDT